MSLVLLGCSLSDPPTGPPTVGVAALRADLRASAESVFDDDQVRAIIAATPDEILLEKYYGGAGRRTTWDVQSVTMSVVSTLVGIALDEGLIEDVDATLGELLPRDRAAMSPSVARTTLRELLTMTGGFPPGLDVDGPRFARADDWVRTILRSADAEPGGSFSYSNGSAHLVAAVLAEAAGTTVLEFARSRLFDPLGIDTRPAMQGVVKAANLPAYDAAGFAWPRDPQGVHTGWWGLKLRPRDLVRLGRLMLAAGMWDRARVVSGAWIADATTRQVPAQGLGTGYGYQWWVRDIDGDRAFAALGYGGQVLEIVPDRDLVVVTTTEVRLGDPTSRGIDLPVLLTILEDAIVRQVPADRP